jgi:hypothetical protein
MRVFSFVIAGLLLFLASCSSHSQKPARKPKVKTMTQQQFDEKNQLLFTETTTYDPTGHAATKKFEAANGSGNSVEYYFYDPVGRMTEKRLIGDSTVRQRIFFFYNDTVRNKWITYSWLAGNGKDSIPGFFTMSRESLAKQFDGDTAIVVHRGGMKVDYQVETGFFDNEFCSVKTSFEYDGNDLVSKKVMTKTSGPDAGKIILTTFYTYDQQKRTITEKTTDPQVPGSTAVKVSQYNEQVQLTGIDYFSDLRKIGYVKVAYEYYP